MKENNQLKIMRHSCSHLLAMAVLKLFPKTKLGIGPAIENGFYYDFEFEKPIIEKDLEKIEKEMKKIKKENIKFEKKEISYEEAKNIFKNQPYKLELISDIENDPNYKLNNINIYKNSSFTDLCKGPHTSSTLKVGPFKLLSLAGAYWKGNEKNKMLTRIYGTCFADKKLLDNHLKILEEVKKRDHREINKILRLYLLSEEIGQGLVTLLPNGTIIAEELEKWAKETEEKEGYVRVLTPHIAKEELFKKTGHIPYYSESMFPPMKMEEKTKGEKDIYYIKPMNCSMHNIIYKSELRSYRDLPLKIAEYGTVYRYEKSGELHGLMRVRGPIHQNDAHIFCTEEQVEEEFQKVMDLHQYYYNALGLTKKDYFLSFAIRGNADKSKFIGDEKMWKKAEKITLNYIKKTKIPYEIKEGDAAFYGPKIDFNIKTVIGKVFSASTNQVDFFIPKIFGLKYIDKDGKEKTPVCIHRAPLGAHVRFIAFLTEHFAGAFPPWLSPIQTTIIPITDKQKNYAQKIQEQLKEEKIRVDLDDRSETAGAKIRNAEIQKIPYMIIVGEKEIKSKSVNIRTRGGKIIGDMKLDKFISLLKEDIDKKRQI